MINIPDLHPARIPGYDSGPLTHHTEYLDEPAFWLGHLYSCAHSEEDERSLFGARFEEADTFQHLLWDRADWPTFTVPLAANHRLHVVYRTLAHDTGTDYLLHHPGWGQAELLARDDAHFMGPGLSWPELVAAADNTLPGGSTTDPHARLLLLLPAFGDDDIPHDATDRLALALRARTRVENPESLASALLTGPGAPGSARWMTAQHGFRVNDGACSFRNPSNPFALPAARLSRAAAALAP